MKKLLIFDLNGVFIKSPLLSDRFKQELNVPEEEFLPVLKDVMYKIRQPKSEPVYELFKPHLKKWEVNLSEEEFLDFWFNVETLNTELLNTLKKLKRKGFTVVILSNNFKERTKYYKENFEDLFILFDKVYFSHETGFMKPDENTFKLVLKDFKIEPSKCIFFDDSKINIEVAKFLGIDAHLFKDKDQVENLINN